MNSQTTPYIFFDQNVREKMSKKKYKSFQDNVDKLSRKRTQRLTAFGLLEFTGLRKEEIFDIKYKGKRFNKYLFCSYEEIFKFIPILKRQLYKKIGKSFLKEKLEQKKDRDFQYLSEEGFNYINKYIGGIESLYNGLIDNLFLDRLSQINISKLSIKEKEKIINEFALIVIKVICQRRNMGGFRLICKIFQEKKRGIVEGEQSKP